MNTISTHKETRFTNIIKRIKAEFSSNDVLFEIVGSYALYLHGVVDIKKVKDLDIVIYTSPNNLIKICNIIHQSKNFKAPYNNKNYSYINNTTLKDFNRFSYYIDGIEICIFLCVNQDTLKRYENNKNEFIANELGKTSYLDIQVKSIKDIIKVKNEFGRAKDMFMNMQICRKIFPFFNISPNKPKIN